jgi:hypothetical protein
MSRIIMGLVAAASLLTAAQVACAQGHVAGGVAGAVVAPKHHKVAGAFVGGAVGHHMAKTKAKKHAAAPPQ